MRFSVRWRIMVVCRRVWVLVWKGCVGGNGWGVCLSVVGIVGCLMVYPSGVRNLVGVYVVRWIVRIWGWW
jgi:hypothetical protein